MYINILAAESTSTDLSVFVEFDAVWSRTYYELQMEITNKGRSCNAVGMKQAHTVEYNESLVRAYL